MDQYTNRTSVFDLIESLEVMKTPSDESSPKIRKVNKHWIFCAWMKDAKDRDDDVFEILVSCIGPDGTEVFSGEPVPFSFGKDIWFFRLTVPDFEIAGYPHLGTYVVEGKIRKAGEKEWFATQEYPFHVREKPTDGPDVPQ